MANVKYIGVRFKKAGKIYYFAPGDISVVSGDKVTFLSSYEMGVLTFDITSGSYLSTPYMYRSGKDLPDESYMTMSNNTIYITNRNENNILILSGE